MEYCRLCTSTTKKPLVPILINSSLNIKEKLEKLLRIIVNASSKLPKSVCLECLTKLNQFNEFFTTSQENQVILEIIFNEKADIVESETISKEPDPLKLQQSDQIDSVIQEIHWEREELREVVFENNETSDNDNGAEVIYETEIQPPAILKKEFHTPNVKKQSEESKKGKKKRKFDRFDCYLCGTQFPGNLQFVQHFRSQHSDQEIRYKCYFCNNYVKKYRSYTRHVYSHQEKRFNCDYCNSSFSQKITLIQHLNSHINFKTYDCSKCNLSFKQNASLFKHNRQKHSNNIPSCVECNKSFVNSSTLSQHMKSKHNAEKDIQCPRPDCPMTFASNSARSYHLNSVHGVKNAIIYGCKLCNKSFKTSVALERHRHKIHKII